jgi:hypothetical protein
MFQNGAFARSSVHLAAVSPALTYRLGGTWLLALSFIVVVGPALALDPPSKPTPPGVIIEPPRPGRDPVVPGPQPPGDGAGDVPGCPSNDRKLELLV